MIRRRLAGRRRAAPAPALLTLAILSAAPFIVSRPVLRDVLASFRLSLGWFFELMPWLLLVAGVAFLLPVAVSSGGNTESRWYPRGRRAYFVWGIVLYLLGSMLCVEVADVWSYAH